MAKRNYLIEGVSGTGKSTVCNELRKRGYTAIDGDKDLAYQGDPVTGEPLANPKLGVPDHKNHLWDVDKVKEIVANNEPEIAFFCGGSRNFGNFLELFDEVFVLDVDEDTLNERLDARSADWGRGSVRRETVLRLHKTKADIPSGGTVINTNRPIEEVVNAILRHTEPIQM